MELDGSGSVRLTTPPRGLQNLVNFKPVSLHHLTPAHSTGNHKNHPRWVVSL